MDHVSRPERWVEGTMWHFKTCIIDPGVPNGLATAPGISLQQAFLFKSLVMCPFEYHPVTSCSYTLTTPGTAFEQSANAKRKCRPSPWREESRA